MIIATLKVKSGSGYTVINADDFDKESMKEATGAEVKSADKKAADALKKAAKADK